MVATSPVEAIKHSRIRHILLRLHSLADATTTYILGSATASTGVVLGIRGRIARLQVTVPAGSTGTLTTNVYVLPGSNTPGANYLAMTNALTPSDLYGSTTAASTALAGAEIAATDRLAINCVSASLGGGTALANISVLLTIETDD